MTDRDGLQPAERLWTPWRMAYVGGETSDPGCVFCNAIAGDDDAQSLILHRGESCFVIMNLYPYNTGHVMIVPNAHQDDLSRLQASTRSEMAELTAAFCTGLQAALRCEGFNTGMNLGDVAGAGIADHLHQHIVPRWRGDANFMPIVGSTKVFPELIPATYAKVRADLARQKSGGSAVTVVPIVPGGAHVALTGDRLPQAPLDPDMSAWPGVVAHLKEWVDTAELLGWAGPAHTHDDTGTAPALAVSITPGSDACEDIRPEPVAAALAILPASDRAAVEACIDRGFLSSARS